MQKKSNESKKLFITGIGFFVVGAFFSYGIMVFFGAVLMIAGVLPPSNKETEEEDGQI